MTDEPDAEGGQRAEPRDDNTGAAADRRRELVLVPLEILEGETIDRDVVEFLAPVDVVVFGYHEVPDQTAPGQMRQQFEERATAALRDVATEFREAGVDADTHLTFTRDHRDSINRVADEFGTTATLVPNPAGAIESVFVPLGGDADPERLAAFVATLRADRGINVTLFAATTEGKREAADLALEAVREGLRAHGVPDAAIATERETTVTPVSATIDAASPHDAVVIGERKRDWQSLVFGELEERIARESLGPVLVVRE